jgi:hypothetical protein
MKKPLLCDVDVGSKELVVAIDPGTSRVWEGAFPNDSTSHRKLIRRKESAGKRKGTSGAKMGNVHLKWAFSEAAVLFVRHSAEAKALVARLTKRHGKGKALSILAHKIGRAAYYVLVREKPFDAATFFAHAS